MQARRVLKLIPLFVVAAVSACGGCGPSSVNPDGSSSTTPGIQSVSVAGDTGSKQIPQGAGAVTLSVLGNGLAGANFPKAGPFAAVINAGGTDSALSLTVTVPHGAALGEQDVSVTTSSGTYTAGGAFTVTPITSAPTGSDTNRGTPDSPLRSVTAAVARAQSGDVVHLSAGTYTAADPESWVVEQDTFPPDAGRNVAFGVTIEGDDAGATVLAGPFTASDAGVPLVGLSLEGNNVLRSLTVSGFDRNVILWAGDLSLQSVELSNASADGLLAFGSGQVSITGTFEGHHNVADAWAAYDNVTVTGSGLNVHDNGLTGGFFAGNASGSIFNSTFTSNGGLDAERRNGGISAAGTGSLLIQSCTFLDNAGVGVGVGASSSATLNNTLISSVAHSPRASGIWGDGVLAFGQAAVAVNSTVVTGTSHDGIAGTDSAALTIAATSVADAGNVGVGVYDASQVTFRNGQILRSGSDGYHVDGPTAQGVVEDTFISDSESSLSIYNGSLRGAGLYAIDAGVFGIYIGNQSSVILSPSAQGNLLPAGLFAVGNYFSTGPDVRASYCVQDSRIADAGSLVRVESGDGLQLYLGCGNQNASVYDVYFPREDLGTGPWTLAFPDYDIANVDNVIELR